MKIVAIIPARYASTRFPGKPLAMISGKPMVQRVYEKADNCKLIDRVIVATDSLEIARTVESFGGETCITASNHETGTDRIAEAAKSIDAQIIVNVQGDEPLIPSEAIQEAIAPVVNDKNISMCTLKTKIRKKQDIQNPNVVKVVTDASNYALYFSRSPIPFMQEGCENVPFFRHIGLYVYGKEFLIKYTEMPRLVLEKAESLEQLRALEHGYSIKVIETNYYPLGVDVPEDILLAEKMIADQP